MHQGGASLGTQWLHSALPPQGAAVPSLDGERRPHELRAACGGLGGPRGHRVPNVAKWRPGQGQRTRGGGPSTEQGGVGVGRPGAALVCPVSPARSPWAEAPSPQEPSPSGCEWVWVWLCSLSAPCRPHGESAQRAWGPRERRAEGWRGSPQACARRAPQQRCCLHAPGARRHPQSAAGTREAPTLALSGPRCGPALPTLRAPLSRGTQVQRLCTDARWLSRGRLCDPTDCSPQDSPDKKTGVGDDLLLQGTFPTQGSNTSLESCIGKWVLYHWCHLGSP